MNPAWSVIFLTVLAGFGQGLGVTLALAVLAGVLGPNSSFLLWGLGVSIAFMLGGLVASFFHLGRPLRGWRAIAMWRTSWLSREVIVLPAFLGLLGLWWLALYTGVGQQALPVLLPLATLVLAFALWVCTAMIYACIRFIQEWSHPLTILNYTLMGLSSGFVLAAALAAWRGESAMVAMAAPLALIATALATLTRFAAFRRNASLKPVSTLHSATGIKAKRLVQMSMGMSGGSFNTREFFHGMADAAIGQLKLGVMLCGFVLPLVFLAWAVMSGSAVPLVLALVVQGAGLLAERWIFFAQARHPQNLYYQRFS